MTPGIPPLLLAVAFTAVVGCAPGSGPPSGDEAAAATIPASSPLSRVRLGMSDVRVREALGNPDHAVAYQTGKRWIPFYWGPDTRRTDWMYRGMGRVVFSRNQYSGALKAIRVDYDPQEEAGL